MSTGAECEFVEIERGKWYYLLELDPGHGYGEWRDRALCQGPFDSLDAAINHLDDEHANPGGWMEKALPDGVLKLDLSANDSLASAIGRAERPMVNRYARPMRRG